MQDWQERYAVSSKKPAVFLCVESDFYGHSEKSQEDERIFAVQEIAQSHALTGKILHNSKNAGNAAKCGKTLGEYSEKPANNSRK